MSKINLYNMQAEVVDELELDDSVFTADYNEHLIHEVIVAMNANGRQGTKSALTRSEVRGHAKKPWKQKHTGRARHGSTKGPHGNGGGVVFAPKPRDFSKKINKQMKRTAFLSAISQKLAQNEITVIDEFKLKEAKTKEVVKFTQDFKFDKSVMIVNDQKDETAMRAINNLQNVKIENIDLLNVYDIVSYKNLVLTKAAIKSIEEAYKE